MKTYVQQIRAARRNTAAAISLVFSVLALPACAATGETESGHHEFSKLEWADTPFGPRASAVYGDFSKGEHVTYIKFPPGMVTPVHTHSSSYTGLVIRGTTMHWRPGEPETEIELGVGSHWRVNAGVPHVSECLAGTECIMAIFQQSAFDFHPAEDLPLSDSSIVAIYQQVNGFDISMGDLASKKAKHDTVKRLGETVRDDHTGVLEATTKLAKEIGVRPVLPVERAAAEQEHQKNFAEIGSKTGDDFDRANLLYEVNFHKNAIAAVESILLPNVKNTKLKALLTDVLPAFKGHLSHTEKLAKDLGYL